MSDKRKEKTKALMLYICSKIPADLSGTIKLHKIMWFSETETMYRTGRPLTGQAYIRMRFGPVALNAPAMREELVSAGKLKQLPPVPVAEGMSRRPFIALETPDMSKFFTDEQIDIIDDQIEKYKLTGAIDISDISHDSIWASLEDADEMPLELYAWRPVYTPEQENSVIEYARQQSELDYGKAPTYC